MRVPWEIPGPAGLEFGGGGGRLGLEGLLKIDQATGQQDDQRQQQQHQPPRRQGAHRFLLSEARARAQPPPRPRFFSTSRRYVRRPRGFLPALPWRSPSVQNALTPRLFRSLPMQAKKMDRGDADVVERALAGEREAWGELIQRHSREVLVFLLARGVRLDRAQELVQETWATLLAQQARGGLRQLRLPGLALTQAHYLLLHEVRRRPERFASLEDLEAEVPEEAVPSPEARLLSRQELERARALLEQCSPSGQRVFQLVFGRPELSHAEVAEHVGLSVQRVRQILWEIRGRLRQLLREDRHE
ncbi:sigma-70 family RNA polymerase sigma factor [Cystobacter fuscus]|nr:sigma-70 family RNA polymerase sigma factor [Cystobacter fuscus]